MDYWINLQLHKWVSAGWIILFALSVFVLFLYGKTKEKKLKYAGLFLLFSVVLFYCPFFAKIMTKGFLDHYAVYERLSWLFFFREVIALAFTLVIAELDKKKQRWAVAFLLVFCLIVSDVIPVVRDFRVPQNIYKIPDDVIAVSDAIVADAGDARPSVLVQEEQIRKNEGNWMYHGIRQYTAKPILSCVAITPEECFDEDFRLDEYGLMRYAYFVCHNLNPYKEQAEAAGFDLLLETDEYCLYKNEKEFTLYFVRHGQTDANVLKLFAGSGTDAMLTEEGIQQAKDTANALSNVSFTDVFISEMTRSKDTAEYILDANENANCKAKSLSLLNDFYWGDLEGMSLEEITELYPDFNMDGYIGTVEDDGFASPVGAWPRYYTISRYQNALSEVAAMTENEGTALVVGHDATSWYFQSLFPDEIDKDENMDNAAITVICYNRGNWELKYYNLSAEEYTELGL